MIVTTDTSHTSGHVVLQREHTSLAHQFAQAFGNQHFAALDPREPMEFVALNHDRGWDAVDAAMRRDPDTGLPYSLDKTPLDLLLATTSASFACNADHHPYAGLLAGMHIWGLYHGRYGLTDQIVIQQLNGEAKAKTEAVLNALRERYESLKANLAADPATSAWVVEAKLMQNYKCLQFFDRLSLYFNFLVGRDGEPVEFHHVPLSPERDTSVRLTPLGKKSYGLAPYPFAAPSLTIKQRCFTVPVATKNADDSYADDPVDLASAPEAFETITLVPQPAHA